MNITQVNNFIGINDNKKCHNRSNPAFKHIVPDLQLKEIFADAKHMVPFVNTIEELKKIPINLIELFNYDKRTGVYRMILDEFFDYVKKTFGEQAVFDFPVTLRAEPLYRDDCKTEDNEEGLWQYDITLHGAFPVEGEEYVPCAGEKNFCKDFKFASSLYDHCFHHEEFDTGKKYLLRVSSNHSFLTSTDICFGDIKEMLRSAFNKRFNDIYKNIFSRNKQMNQETENVIIEQLQRVIDTDKPIFSDKDTSGVSDTQLVSSAYEILNITDQQSLGTNYIIKSLFKSAGIDVDDNTSYSTRVKGQRHIDSLVHKMLTCMQSSDRLWKAVRRNQKEDVLESVYDIYGVRLKAKTQQEINKFYNEFVNFIKVGVIKPTHIMNYHATFTEPFFSDKQIEELKALTKELGLKTEFHDDRRESGFTCTNIRTKVVIEKGKEQPVEIQVCNRDTAYLIDILHIAYDVLEGKNVLSKYDNEKKEIIKPLVKALDIIKNDEVLRKKFSRYTAICYSVARDGSREFPDITEYDLPEIVSVEKMAEVYEQLNNIVYA